MRGTRSTLAAFAVAATLLLSGCSSSAGASPTPTATTPTRIGLPAHPTAYFFGDSWTQGYSAAAGKGYPYVASTALGWKPTFAPDGSGTGYIHVNEPSAPTYPQRAAALPASITTDVVVLQGSINDETGSLSQLDDAVTRTVGLLREKTGNAPIIMLGPAPASLPISYELYEIDAQLAADAKRLGIPYISPIRGNWITTKNIGSIIDPATAHPDTAGHAYFGGRVAGAIKALVATKSAAR